SLQAALGRQRAAARRRERQAVPQPGALRAGVLGRAGLRLRSDEQPHPVFKKDGSFVQEFALAPATAGNGSVWDLDFSRDPDQSYLYAADGENNHVWMLSRATGKVLSHFGRSGRYA